MERAFSRRPSRRPSWTRCSRPPLSRRSPSQGRFPLRPRPLSSSGSDPPLLAARILRARVASRRVREAAVLERCSMSIASLVFVVGAAVAGDPDPVLQGLVDAALANNPQLAATRQLERAAAARPRQEGSRPGPSVGVFYQNDGVAPSLGREPMTMLGLSAAQEIPYPGKRGLRRQ